LAAGTETRHDFLVHEDLLQWSSLRTSRKRHNLVQQQFILHSNVETDILGGVAAVKSNHLYKRTCLYIILYTSSVYNMLMYLQVYNTSGKYLIKEANSNQHHEASKIKNRVLGLKLHRLRLR